MDSITIERINKAHPKIRETLLQQYEEAKASVQAVGQSLKTPPPSSTPVEVAKEVVSATAPTQYLRRHKYY